MPKMNEKELESFENCLMKVRHQRWKKFEKLLKKYEKRALEDDDIIDIKDMKIVVDNGVLRNRKPLIIGKYKNFEKRNKKRVVRNRKRLKNGYDKSFEKCNKNFRTEKKRRKKPSAIHQPDFENQELSTPAKHSSRKDIAFDKFSRVESSVVQKDKANISRKSPCCTDVKNCLGIRWSEKQAFIDHSDSDKQKKGKNETTTERIKRSRKIKLQDEGSINTFKTLSEQEENKVFSSDKAAVFNMTESVHHTHLKKHSAVHQPEFENREFSTPAKHSSRKDIAFNKFSRVESSVVQKDKPNIALKRPCCTDFRNNLVTRWLEKQEFIDYSDSDKQKKGKNETNTERVKRCKKIKFQDEGSVNTFKTSSEQEEEKVFSSVKAAVFNMAENVPHTNLKSDKKRKTNYVLTKKNVEVAGKVTDVSSLAICVISPSSSRRPKKDSVKLNKVHKFFKLHCASTNKDFMDDKIHQSLNSASAEISTLSPVDGKSKESLSMLKHCKANVFMFGNLGQDPISCKPKQNFVLSRKHLWNFN